LAYQLPDPLLEMASPEMSPPPIEQEPPPELEESTDAEVDWKRAN
jgi:hypothetical protein